MKSYSVDEEKVSKATIIQSVQNSKIICELNFSLLQCSYPNILSPFQYITRFSKEKKIMWLSNPMADVVPNTNLQNNTNFLLFFNNIYDRTLH